MQLDLNGGVVYWSVDIVLKMNGMISESSIGIAALVLVL